MFKKQGSVNYCLRYQYFIKGYVSRIVLTSRKANQEILKVIFLISLINILTKMALELKFYCKEKNYMFALFYRLEIWDKVIVRSISFWGLRLENLYHWLLLALVVCSTLWWPLIFILSPSVLPSFSLGLVYMCVSIPLYSDF